MNFVSVIIPNYCGARLLEECLPSVQSQTGVKVQVIVVDNGSADASREVAEACGAEWLPLSQNYGYPFACNAGARQARGDFLLFMNNDMVLMPDCLLHMVQAAEANPDTFAIDACHFSYQDRHLLQHGRTVLKRGSWFSHTLPGYAVDYAIPVETLSPVPWACAGCLFVHRRRFWEIGGFNGRFFIDFEDLEICLRAGLRGYTCYVEPRARLFHGISQTERVLPPAEKKRYIRRRLIGQQKNRLWIYGVFWPAPALFCIYFCYILKTILYFITGRFSSAAAWFSAGLQHAAQVPSWRRERKSWKGSAGKKVTAYFSRFLA